MTALTSSPKSRELPETINIHLTRACNFACRFCYAEFAECDSTRIHPDQLQQIVKAISLATPLPRGRCRKVNFAGGEPLLYAGLPAIVELCKQLGLTTSLVTNGSLLDEKAAAQFSGSLDICALSIDSGIAATNAAIGRRSTVFQPDVSSYQAVAQRIIDAGMRFKVNTVVNRLNLAENLGDLVGALRPFRWKLFQVKEVIGQNEKTFAELSIDHTEFEQFVKRNRALVPPSITVVPESADDMTSSYAMIAPNGCFFDSSLGRHSYSRPILDVGIAEAFQEVAFEAAKFEKRGGSYE
jgi:radical S-adenosyl methionine domain-containing protein 2